MIEREPLGGQRTRRTFLVESTSLIAAGMLSGHLMDSRPASRRSIYELDMARDTQLEALRVLGRTTLRLPDSMPNPMLPTGTDTLPEIEHVVVLMLENHSYDNILGMLGRGPGERPRGDGFRLGADGLPTATNPYPDGSLQRAFRMPTTCQLSNTPSQEWAASHAAYDNGQNDGFVRTTIDPGTSRIVGAVAMGYWTGEDLPLTYALAERFPVGDRWFCSCLGQTDPNRRFLIAATASGMTDDIGTSPGNAAANSTFGVPAVNGTIFERLTQAGISWANYSAHYPTGTTMELYPANDTAFRTKAPPINRFFSDAKAGTLPQFSLLDPDYSTQSQENPQNMAVGEAFLGQVIDALRNSPLWRKTLLVLNYDEHGGYYDHVPPPAAIAPDSIPPVVNPGESTYDGYARYGFRVPAVVVSPYAKPGYVSHVVYDHTSILALLERKWNLGAMTYRDANANDLTDFLDLNAMKAGQPTFPELPHLAAPGDTPARLACTRTGPGTIPPPTSVHRGRVQKVRIRSPKASRRFRGIVVELETNFGTVSRVEVELRRGHKLLARKRIQRVGTRRRRVVLRVQGGIPHPGRYLIEARKDGRLLAERRVDVHVSQNVPRLVG